MATVEEGGSTANTSSSPYGVGGVGGKFRKKPVRRQGTPYDRPATAALRRIGQKPGGWLSTLVLDPACKLISYGADRFFASVFRKRLPAPPPPPPLKQEANHDMNVAAQDTIHDDKEATLEPVASDCSCPINNSDDNEFSELEQMLKAKKFTRSEIVHLTALLQSKTEFYPGDGFKAIEESTSDFLRHRQFPSGPVGENLNDGTRSSAPSPFESKVREDDIASPTEVAKTYMGARTSKLSPSALRIRHHSGREDTRFPSNGTFAAKSPVMSLDKKNPASFAPENGFATPKSRGRTAIYNMARTQYSRDRPASVLKGNGVGTNSYMGQATSSSSLHPLENAENYGSRTMNLKRRSSLLEDESGSIGPIRRIRQKSNLMASRIPQITDGGVSSHAKKLELIGEPSGKVSRNSVENESQTPIRSFAHVPPKSTEVAAKILKHLEKMTPKDKSPESNSIGGVDKSHMKLTASMLSGKALRSMEVVESPKLPTVIQDDEVLGVRQNKPVPDARHPLKSNTNGLENGCKESFFRPGNLNFDMNNRSALTSKSLRPNTSTSDTAVNDCSYEPSQKKRAFRMSVQEDMLELDDDIQCNGLSSRSVSKISVAGEAPSTESRLQPPQEPELVKATIQLESVSPSASIGSKVSELSGDAAFSMGEKSSSHIFPSSGEPPAISQSEMFPLPVGKTKEANGPAEIVSITAQVANNVSSLPSVSTTKAQSKLESSSSLVSFSPSTCSQVKFPESDKGGNPSHVASVPAVSFAANGSHASSPFTFPFSASSSGTTQKATGSAFLFASSTGGADMTTSSTSAPSGNSIFGPSTRISSLAEPFSDVAAPSAATISEASDRRNNAEMNGSSASSTVSQPAISAVGAANSGNNTFGLGSYFSQPTAANLQGSLFGDSSRTLESGAGTLQQKSSLQAASSLPSFSVNGSTTFSSSSGSQAFNPSNVVASSASTSSSNASAVIPSSLAASKDVKPDAISAAIEGNALNPSSVPPDGSTHHDFNASSTKTSGSNGGASQPNFVFGVGSSVSAPATNTATSSFGSGSSNAFQFVGSSTGSSLINSISTSVSPSNLFAPSWQGTKSLTSGSTFTSQSPSTGLAFSAFPTASNSSNVTPVFGASTGVSSSNPFLFSASSAPAMSSASLPTSQPVFVQTPAIGFAASPGNNDQMNAEDNSMAEDPVQSASLIAPAFGQPFAPQSTPSSQVYGGTAPSSLFGLAAPPHSTTPYMFNSQPNQASPFQASGSLEFNGSGSGFSMGSGGGTSSRKIVRVSQRNKNRKK